MNNKKLGTDFEREMVSLLSQIGYWVHFITPDKSGKQPFDIIASKDNEPLVGDCKTTAIRWFNISRLEDNQIMAFELWLRTGNKNAFVFVKFNGNVYAIPYIVLKNEGKINLENRKEFML